MPWDVRPGRITSLFKGSWWLRYLVSLHWSLTQFTPAGAASRIFFNGGSHTWRHAATCTLGHWIRCGTCLARHGCDTDQWDWAWFYHRSCGFCTGGWSASHDMHGKFQCQQMRHQIWLSESWAKVGFAYVVGSITASLGQLRTMSEEVELLKFHETTRHSVKWYDILRNYGSKKYILGFLDQHLNTTLHIMYAYFPVIYILT